MTPQDTPIQYATVTTVNNQSVRSLGNLEPALSTYIWPMPGAKDLYTDSMVNVVESSRESSIIPCRQTDSAQLEKPLSQRNQ